MVDRVQPDGTSVLTASEDHTAWIWDFATGTVTTELRGHTGKVYGAAFHPDGTQVITASETGRPLSGTPTTAGRCWSCAATPGSTRPPSAPTGSWWRPGATTAPPASTHHRARIRRGPAGAGPGARDQGADTRGAGKVPARGDGAADVAQAPEIISL